MMSLKSDSPPPAVVYVVITEEHVNQRLDNFLLTYLKGVPKSHVYRIVRKGEVRINKGRADISRRLSAGDVVRIPPLRRAEDKPAAFIDTALREALENAVIFEDDYLLIINKPAGFPVHGGTGIHAGIIEGLRQIRAGARILELVHRLDRDTSGCLVIAKKRSALRQMHELFRSGGIEKTYLALLAGRWARKKLVVSAPLQKYINKGGERMVAVSPHGKPAETFFRRLKLLADATLVQAEPKTGRTHQIRVHAAHLGHPIVGDERYGLAEQNRHFKTLGFSRLALHAETLRFRHPATANPIVATAPVPAYLKTLLEDERPL